MNQFLMKLFVRIILFNKNNINYSPFAVIVLNQYKIRK